jgi:ribonucleotide monophosphatase NagD (HAD superfamily)
LQDVIIETSTPLAPEETEEPPIEIDFDLLAGEGLPPPAPKDRMLAIGDGLKTDLLGAGEAGLRSVFIASALHVDPRRDFDEALLAELFAAYPHPPIAAQPALRW